MPAPKTFTDSADDLLGKMQYQLTASANLDSLAIILAHDSRRSRLTAFLCAPLTVYGDLTSFFFNRSKHSNTKSVLVDSAATDYFVTTINVIEDDQS